MTVPPDNQVYELLLVEDDPDQVLLFKATIALDGGMQFHVTSVSSVAGALNELELHEYGLILLDLFVDDMRGIATFKAFHEYFNKIPIVVLTSFASESLADETLAMGAADYVIKGDYLGRAIVNIIRRAISRHRNIEDLMIMCSNMKQRLDILQGRLRVESSEDIQEIKSIATAIERKAVMMRAG